MCKTNSVVNKATTTAYETLLKNQLEIRKWRREVIGHALDEALEQLAQRLSSFTEISVHSTKKDKERDCVFLFIKIVECEAVSEGSQRWSMICALWTAPFIELLAFGRKWCTRQLCGFYSDSIQFSKCSLRASRCPTGFHFQNHSFWKWWRRIIFSFLFLFFFQYFLVW